MKVVIAIDSFKGSLSSVDAGKAVSEGIKRVYSDAECVICPVADGGEGTVEALCEGMGGEKISVDVTGPLGDKVCAVYGKIGTTAVMEMAAAAGITLVPNDRRNPLYTTTYGVGEMIKDAVARGCRNFIMGIGGSATNDGGIGMLQALGFSFLDESGKEIPCGAVGLKSLHSVHCKKAMSELAECSFNIACDVTNPLCGELGCSAVYGPQKGATPEMISDMDNWLSHYADLSGGDKNASGAGAAGGMGYAFMTFLKGELQNGIELVLKEVKLAEQVADADYVITGEGRLDSQTVMGKAPSGVAKVAKSHGIPVIAFSGCVTKDARVCNDCGIDAFFPVLRNIVTLDEALNKENAFSNLADTAEQVFRVIKVIR